MSDTPDFAFSSCGWAYLTGRDGREPNTIIRTHPSTEDSKDAQLTLLLEFEPRENQGWTEKDLEVTDVPLNELSVVVGELLPEGYKESVFPGNMRSAEYSTLFDPSVHEFVGTAPTTGIMVKQLNHDGCSLYLLHGRQYGVYRKHLLPSENDLKHRIVYYREWTDKFNVSQEEYRRAAFNEGICGFTKAYIQDHQDEFCDVLTTSTWDVPHDALRALSPRDSIISFIQIALSLWKDGGETGHLEQLYSVIMECLGRPNWAGVEGTDTEGHLKLLQIMITGQDDFDMGEAREALKACQALWPVATHGPARITPEALYQLVRGLRAGALSDKLIDESLYRAFITLFCSQYTDGLAEGDEALHVAIQKAYDLADASVGQPLNTQEPVRVIPSDFLHRLIRSREEHLRRLKEHWTAERDVVMELGGKTTELVSWQELLRKISSSMDVEHCRELAAKLFQMGFFRHDLFARSVVTFGENELKVLKAFWNRLPVKNDEDHGGNDTDGEEDEEDDDEAMEDDSEMD